MKQYRVGIIGCGSIFPMHSISVARQVNAKLVAVCDIKEERAKARASEYNCAYYLDYREMIDQADLDVVHICTPHYLHAPMAVYAANKGVHVLTEKPMSISLADACEMIGAAEKNGVVLGVIFQNRYNPGSKLVKEMLVSGQLGRIISSKLSVTWKRTDEYYSKSDWKGTWDKEGGGVDLARWLVDSEIEFVDASISNRTHSLIEVEDAAEGVIKYKNGVLTCFYAVNYYGYDAPVEIELSKSSFTASAAWPRSPPTPARLSSMMGVSLKRHPIPKSSSITETSSITGESAISSRSPISIRLWPRESNLKSLVKMPSRRRHWSARSTNQARRSRKSTSKPFKSRLCRQ